MTDSNGKLLNTNQRRRGSINNYYEHAVLEDTLDKCRSRRRSTVILTEYDLVGKNIHEAEAEKIREEQKRIKLNLRDYNLIFFMPFFCTVATRLPFIYFVIQLRERGLDYVTIGFLIGAFHFCRVIAIASAIFHPKAAHLLGSMIGLAGYITLLCADKSNITMFAVGNIITGFAEASAAVFVYSKNMYATDAPKMRMAMSNQSATIGVAVIIGFFFGGIAFDKFGVDGIAVAGIIALGIELASLLYYLLTCSEGDIKNQSRSDKVLEATLPEEEKNSEFTFSRVLTSLQKEELSAELTGMYSTTEGIVANSFTLLISAIFSIESIACGYLFSIGPMFIKNTFGVDEESIGIIFSCASLFGSIGTIISISPKGRAFQKTHLRSPYNLYILVVVVTCSVLGCLVPIFSVHVISVLSLIGACELFLTLVSELQGAITTSHYYTVLGPSAQMLRRIMNVVMAVTGPIAYGVFPRLPYLISSCLCFIFSVVFIFSTEAQNRKNAKRVAEMMDHGKDNDAEIKNFERMSLASRECLARISSLIIKGESKNTLKNRVLECNIEEEDDGSA